MTFSVGPILWAPKESISCQICIRNCIREVERKSTWLFMSLALNDFESLRRVPGSRL